MWRGSTRPGASRDSARTGASRGQTIAAGLALAATTLGGIFAPLEAFFTLALLLGPIFLGLILLRLAATMEDEAPDPWRSQRWRLDDSRPPTYTVAVAMYREEAVLRQLVTALQALDYPPAKLDIRLLIEADDSGMRAALARMELPAHFTISIVPPGNPRTTPRALNLALLEARGSLFTIFDAEDIPDPQQLRMAAARFLAAPPELACLQARLVIDHAGNGTLPGPLRARICGTVRSAQSRAAALWAAHPARRHIEPFPHAGAAEHRRLGCLERHGGCRSGPRGAARAGYRMGDLPSSTREEAPDNIPAWLRQRSRWIKGYMQTIVTHSRRPLSLVREAGLAATFFPSCRWRSARWWPRSAIPPSPSPRSSPAGTASLFAPHELRSPP